jgi:hypothetical protein
MLRTKHVVEVTITLQVYEIMIWLSYPAAIILGFLPIAVIPL